jgi:hypothetical protein
VCVRVGQLKLAIKVFGWKNKILEADSSLDLSLGQGGGGVVEQKRKLLAVLIRICDIARRLRLESAAAPTMMPIARPVQVACGQRAAARVRCDEEWEQEREQAALLAAEDDQELLDLDREFKNQMFFDPDDGQTRIIKTVNYSAEFSMFMAETRRIGRGGAEMGKSRPHSDDFYGLGPLDLAEMRRMVTLAEQ